MASKKAQISNSAKRINRCLDALDTTIAIHINRPFQIYGQRHTHRDNFHITYILQGDGHIAVDDRHYDVGPNDCLFIRPGWFHQSFKEHGKHFEVLLVKFSARTPEAMRAVPNIPAVLSISNQGSMVSAMERLLAAFLTDPSPDNWLTRFRLAETLLLLDREGALLRTDSSVETKLQRSIQAAMNYISLRYAETIQVEELARLAHLSPSHFTATFRKVTGTSPIEMLLQRRLHHARELLRTSTFSIGQIAEVCGFHSPHYFARVFSKREGLSPRAYREKIRGKEQYG